MDIQSLLSKIGNLRGISDGRGFDQKDQKTFDLWEKTLGEITIIEDLRAHAGIQTMIKSAIAEVQSINDQLKSTVDMSQDQRAELFYRRSFFEWFLDFFMDAKMSYNDIEKDVDTTMDQYRELLTPQQ